MIDELRAGALFSLLPTPQLERVAQRARRLQLTEGQRLFEQGDSADRFFLLLTGQVKLYRLAPTGHEKVIEIIQPVNTFAEALMFLDQPHYPVGAQALQAATLISIDTRDFAAMLRSSVDTCFLLLGDMSQRLRALIHEIDHLTLQNASCRLASYLLQRIPAPHTTCQLDVTKQILASRLSMTPETLSRLLRILSDEVTITVQGSHITLNNRAYLQQLAAACGGVDSTF